jgi:glycerate kinase
MTTYGTGQLIKAAVEKNVQEIIIGIGGSATNDGGIGMAEALGFKFMDKQGRLIKPIGENLINIHCIDSNNKIDLKHIRIQVACDVKNYLCGANGAANVYGPQKGALPEDVQQLETGMLHYAGIVKRDLGIDLLQIEGGGAAGGLGAGCVCFLNARLISGIKMMMQISKAEHFIKNADIVITGEGRLDRQTLQGKVVAGVSTLARKFNKEVIAMCGSKEITSTEIEKLGLSAVIAIADNVTDIEVSMKNAFSLLYMASVRLGKQILSTYNNQ